MLTLYRIIDKTETDTIVLVDSLSNYEHAFQTLLFLRAQQPSSNIVLEEYQKSTVTGYGRDPDLH